MYKPGPRRKKTWDNMCKKFGYDDFKTLLESEYSKVRTARELGNHLGLTEATVCNYLHACGIPIKSRPRHRKDISNDQVLRLIKQGWKYREIAEKLGVTHSFVGSIAKGARSDPGVEPKKEFKACKICGAKRGMNRWYCGKCLSRISSETATMEDGICFG